MRAKLLKLWSDLVESFWLVPAVMAVLAMLGALGAVSIDRDYKLGNTAWIWSGGASGARSLLSTVASSMMTVAGTVFSITIAALTLASQQFGPRLLRNFTTDRGNQIVLGTFVATFLYCLMVLRTVRGQDEGHFVPNLAISIAVLLACASLGVLIYFIQHMTSSIQAESLSANVARELKSDLHRLIPPAAPAPGDAPAPVELPDRAPQIVLARKSGYVQAIDRDSLVARGEEHGLLVRLRHQPGDFVSEGEALLDVWAGSDTIAPDITDALCNNVQFGERRTPWQDPRYGIRQLTEIGARALSPGINDPFTAMGCLDWLIDALEEIAGRGKPTGVSYGEGGTPRVLEDPVGFADLLSLSVDPIRVYGSNTVLLAVYIMQSLSRLAVRVQLPEERQAVLQEARLTWRAAEAGLTLDSDRARVADAFAAVQARIGLAPPSAGKVSPADGVRADQNPA